MISRSQIYLINVFAWRLLVSEEKVIYDAYCKAFEHVWKRIKKPKTICKTSDFAGVFKKYRDKKEEYVIVAYLNHALKVIDVVEIAHGSNISCPISPAVVFKKALALDSTHLIIGHNHPSGDLNISDDDIAVTKDLIGSGDMLGVAVLDHVVFSFTGYVSVLEEINKEKVND